ncbi:hypothetical protein [Streptomyces sp. NBC_00140]|uniref:hypothetical protein n=1 Tax=Streptomyces sp. NBC_00140 TaxID=2975664 RepID=UPI002253F8F3|nr:hypothetical protein [Streptomyces sp. NBC_00140]MCX5332105.1 hypothetical protein [Streptomyces sp. NBC_00140]
MSDTTETSTAVIAETRLRRLLRLAAASRQVVELEWEHEALERIEQQVTMAVHLAGDQTYDAFPDTLARVIEPGEWVGYPALYVDSVDYEWGIAPCAVTYLEEGLWLHHTPGVVPEPQWTLIVPCVCGRYREVPVTDDYSLARELEHLDAHHDVCFGDCTPSALPSAATQEHGLEGAA